LFNNVITMKKVLGTIALYALPVLVFAQGSGVQLGNFNSGVNQVQQIVNLLIPVVTALALLFFFWGLAKFILAAGDEAAKDEGKRIMIWGVVALFVMAAVWGLIQFIGEIFGVDTSGGQINTPRIR